MFVDILFLILFILTIVSVFQFLVDMLCFSQRFEKLCTIRELRSKFSAIALSKFLKVNNNNNNGV